MPREAKSSGDSRAKVGEYKWKHKKQRVQDECSAYGEYEMPMMEKKSNEFCTKNNCLRQ